MGKLIIDDNKKIGVERLLLGDIEVDVKDCHGNTYTITGLTANDLIVKDIQGGSKNLVEFIKTSAYIGADATTMTVTNSKGEQVVLKDVIDSIDNINFEIDDLQTKYNNL